MRNKIGRFKVIEQLGEGSQGTVFLCLDKELQRKVAIKLLNKSKRNSAHKQADFLSEARSMSKNQHPNIVSIYEVGKEEEVPYLVCEYINGELLSKKLLDGQMAISQSLDIFQGVLKGISQAHQNGIVHRDLKPSNIIISDENGSAKVMDFGVAKTLTDDPKNKSHQSGSPRYIAPETIKHGTVGCEMDVFALGVIFSEMLTGKPLFNGESQQAIFDEVCNKTIEPPSKLNSEIDEQLDRIVLKALERDPTLRYPTAEDMLKALTDYRQGDVNTDDDSQKDTTLEFLLRRMRRKSDFPALSGSVRSLNAITMASDKDAVQMSSVIVKDFSLANKILKVVNSAYYGRFSGKIGTVSRAVVVLGVQPVRSLAASLIFFEHMQNQAHAKRLKGLISKALFTAVLAKAFVADEDDAEDYFLAGMLHELGKLLVAFYLPSESEDIDRLTKQESQSIDVAVHQVLGSSYESIGEGIAKQWNFPTSLTDSMRRFELKPTMKGVTGELHKQLTIDCSNKMSNLIAEGEGDTKQELKALFKRYGEGLALSAKQFEILMDRSVKEYVDLVKLLVPETNISFLKKLTETLTTPEEKSDSVDRNESDSELIEAAGSMAEAVKEAEKKRGSITEEDRADQFLSEGLQEVTNMMVEGEGVSQICNVVLETLYRAIGFQRIVLSLRSGDGKQIVARMGFGEDIETFKKGFRFPIAYSPDIFHVAMKNSVDIYIADSNEDKVKKNLPDWYSKSSNAGSFFIFPLSVKKKPLGLIYADHPDPNGLHVDGKRLNLIKALRNQIVLAFQSH
jgi:serine/threonine protein kinase